MQREQIVCVVDLEPDGFREGRYNHLIFNTNGSPRVGKIYVRDDDDDPYKPPEGYGCFLVVGSTPPPEFTQRIEYDPEEGVATILFDDRVLSRVASFCRLIFVKGDDVIKTKWFSVFSHREG